MALSPAPSEQHARVIRELARDLKSSPRSLPSPSPSPIGRDQNDESYQSPPGSSAFDPTQDALVSTQQLDDNTNTRPLLRSSARRFGFYQPPAPLPYVDTSMVAKEFGSFDQEVMQEDDSMSIEIPRGGKKSANNTPGKSRLSTDFSPVSHSKANHNSLYDLTPPSRTNPRRTLGATGALRRDAQIRSASTAPQNEVNALLESRAKTAASERQRSTLSQMHSKVVSEEEESFNEERPPTITNTFKSTRFGVLASQRVTNAARISNILGSAHNTPQRQMDGTPRSATGPNNGTQQSFMLPDLPNLTELVSGMSHDGTPVSSKAAKPRTRYSSAPTPSRFSSAKSIYPPIESVPIPSDEKALFASLQLLKEKIAQLEQDKVEAENTIQEQAAELKRLGHSTGTQARNGNIAQVGPGSGARSQAAWEVEKSKLKATVETLRTRLDRAERKLSVQNISEKQATSDRDTLYQQLDAALITSEELKMENEALETENRTLRDEVDALRLENATLRREGGLRTKHTSKRLARARDLDEEFDSELEAQRSKRAQELAKKTQRKEKAEFAKLKAENDALRLQLANVETQRGEEQHVWAQREGELRVQLDIQNDTLRQFMTGTQADVNEALRQDNESLRIQLIELSSQRDHERQQWANKEARLRQKIEKREDVLQVQQDQQATSGPKRGLSRQASGALNPSGLSTKLSDRREKDTQTRIADRVEQEIRKSRSAVTRPQSSHVSRSRSKSQSAEHRQSTAQSSRLTSASNGISYHNMDAPSEAESTTDLSIARVRGGTIGQSRVTTGNTVTQFETMDMTDLSFMGRDEIAQLRKTLEEERAAAKKRSSLPAQVVANDTVQSNMSKVSQQHTLPRKSSLKVVTKTQTHETEGTKHSDFLEVTAQHKTEESILSNSSRRRRSAPVELTSAFIIPDITVRVPSLAHGIDSHDFNNCTVCNRSKGAAKKGALAPSTSIPTPVPVSSREDLGPDATIRPSQSPQDALAQVLKELEDELAHLKMDLAAQETLLQSHDPALGKRQRKAVQARMQELLKAIDIRFDQIYALYDVLEGQKADGLLDNQDSGEQHKRMSEQEINDTLRSVGLDPLEARRGKKVTINEVDDDDESLPEGSDFDDDLPWEGISDIESTRSFHRDLLRRNGALEV